jgi:(E)-4-hydroxy-3-methylbut-2-enyl-diphosphate synthase
MGADLAGGQPLHPLEVVEASAVESVLRSVDLALTSGLGEDRIVVSAKVSSPPSLIRIYRRLARELRQPLHLGLTEAGFGRRGIVRSIAAAAPLLAEGIGDTLRLSLTPGVDDDRTDEAAVARELLQALGLRSFAPTVIACPGCGRTASALFRRITERVEAHLEAMQSDWSAAYPGVENLTVAVMGCVVNGPGESRAADIGISLPGAGEAPSCPVYTEGVRTATITGDADELAARFIGLLDRYVDRRFRRAP